MQCLHILLTPKSVQYGVGFFSTLRLFHGTVLPILPRIQRADDSASHLGGSELGRRPAIFLLSSSFAAWIYPPLSCTVAVEQKRRRRMVILWKINATLCYIRYQSEKGVFSSTSWMKGVPFQATFSKLEKREACPRLRTRNFQKESSDLRARVLPID